MTDTASRPVAVPRVFISYRRSDSQAQANGLFDGLCNRLPSSTILLGIDSIPPGVVFEEHIRHEIEACDVVLVLIGNAWLEPKSGANERPVDDPTDFVRLEIENALAAPQVMLVPVLVGGAEMPHVSQLPVTMRGLARISSIELSDRSWTNDVAKLTELVHELGRKKAQRYQPPPRPQTNMPAPTPNYPPTPTYTTAPPPPTYAAVPPPPMVAVPPRYVMTPAASQAQTQQARATAVGWVMVVLPFFTIGLAGFVPPLWAASKRSYDRKFVRRMRVLAATIGLVTVTGLGLLSSGPEDASGTPTGPISDLGGFIWLGAIIAATITAVRYRKPPATALAGTARELANREQRSEYRKLIASDPSLARGIFVGRPDLRRDYDDGGLLDLNHVTAEQLVQFGQMSAEEAESIVAARTQLGQLQTIEEVTVYANLSEVSTASLRERAVFL